MEYVVEYPCQFKAQVNGEALPLTSGFFLNSYTFTCLISGLENSSSFRVLNTFDMATEDKDGILGKNSGFIDTIKQPHSSPALRRNTGAE